MTKPINKIKINTEFADYVFCNNCETEMLVDVGEEVCPVCGNTGTMPWIDDRTPEVEVKDCTR